MNHGSVMPLGASACREIRPGPRSTLGGPPKAPLLLFLVAALQCADGLAQDATELQAQIEQQRAENQALKARIEQFEQVLKTDVCKNPEAAKLLEEEPAASAPVPAPAKGK